MILIDKPANGVIETLERKGISAEEIIMCARLDKDRDGVRCDNWLFLSTDGLILLSGVSGLKGKNKGLGSKRLTVSFNEISYEFHPLDEIKKLSVEELISSSRLVAEIQENADIASSESGKTLLLSYLTNTCKSSAYSFSDYFSQYKEKGSIEVNEEDFRSGLFCPECGQRYADPDRKICPKCMNRGKIILRTSSLLIKYRLNIVLLFITMAMTSGLAVLAPYVSSGFFYDEVLSENGSFYGQLMLVIGIIVATRVLATIVDIISRLISTRVASRMAYDLKKTIFGAIERLSVSFFSGRQTGGLMTQVNSDAETIYAFFCDGLPYVVINIIQLVVILVIMFMSNLYLTLLAVLTMPFIILLTKVIFVHERKLHAKRYSRSRSLNAMLGDVLGGVRVVKAFSKEKTEIARFEKKNINLAVADRSAAVFSSTAFPSVTLLITLSTMIVWGVGGWMVIQGKMTYGTLLVFIAYMGMLFAPLIYFIEMMNWGAECMNSMSRLIEVMDAMPDVTESAEPKHIETAEGRVTFDRVEFSYVKNRKIIDGVSFDIEPGGIIGIVGHTGAGKSTLANLLIRLYDVTAGEIRIDGINVKDIAFSDLRRNVAIVSQETYLFAGTILENIRYANPDASFGDVISASKAAGAHDFIMKLPDAYSTMIGFGHKDLSGGERQRVSIARAILRNPRILIMDEATAAMDTETERQIQNSLSKLTRGRTTIIIAHRLSTLRDADKLLVIENGRIPEAGTHAELIAKKGIYYNLYKLQADALKNVGIDG